MSIARFAAEIDRFLAGTGGEVLCITGKWGVGKTFAWNHFLDQARSERRIAPKRYAYVSLFGLNSLDEVRHALFEGSVNAGDSNRPADFDSVKASMDTLRVKWKNALGFAKLIPSVSDYAAIAGRLGFLGVRDQLICFDDLERLSSSLSMRDILGLVSFLKEQRSCRVAILLNDEQLSGENNEEFRSQLEKVADAVLRFSPTPQEAAEIGVDSQTAFSKQLRTDCVALGLVNIRTIKKIERFCRRLQDLLSAHDPRIMTQAVHSTALFGYSKFQPDLAPSIEFLRSFNRYEGLLDGTGAELPNRPWRDLLTAYDFGALDELDSIILQGIEEGYFDGPALEAAAVKLDERYRLQDQDASFSNAWDAYHDSFDNNDDEVLDGLERAIRSNAPAISPGNFSSTITLLKELGRGDRTGDLINHFVNSRNDPREFWDLEDYAFGERVTDPDVRAAFDQKLATFPEERDLERILINLSMNSGWNRGDVPYLASQPVEAYRALFKRLRNPDLRRAIGGGLTFRNIVNADADMVTVTQLVTEALTQIAAESPMNRARVIQKGIALDP